jgi:hypothetical protein
VDIAEQEGLCALVSPYESGAQTYGFDCIKILAHNTDCRAVAIAAVVPDNLARICIDSSVDLYSIRGELIMAVKAPKEVWP